jgi:hypothetical protein
MVYWTEFKSAILPWVIAGSLIWLLVSDGRRREEEFAVQQLRLSQSLENLHLLMSTQGYISPPITPTTDNVSPFVGLE